MKKFYRVEQTNIETEKIYNTRERNYGLNLDFKKYQHFLNAYLRAMFSNNISVDFLVSINNQIYLHGNKYLQTLKNAIVNEEYIDIYKVTKNANHINQTIPILSVNNFLQSFDDTNQFILFDNGTYLWEIMCEVVRANFYKDKPNRLSSIFLFDSLDSCNYFISNHLNGFGKIYEVELLEEEAFFVGDMSIIDNIENHILYEDLLNEFSVYWRGEMQKNPIKEIIFQGTYLYKPLS